MEGEPKKSSLKATKSGRKPRKPGRRERLTDTVQEKVCRLIKVGNYKVVAAQLSGIGERTFYTWYAKGDPDHPGHKRKYERFRQAVDEAEAASESLIVSKIIRKAGARELLDLLGRRFPERWRKRVVLDHSGQIAADHFHEVTLSQGRNPADDTGGVRIVIGEAGDVWNPSDDPGYLLPVPREARDVTPETPAVE